MSQTIYFHGMPGAASEAALFGLGEMTSPVFALERAELSDRAIEVGGATAISERYSDTPLRLVAFSLGVRPALEVAARLGDQVEQIDLISSAAPLCAVDRDIAGYGVFMAARHRPKTFAVLTGAQALAARYTPRFLYDALFKSARGADVALAREPSFRRQMAVTLNRCFEDGGHNYRRELRAYVAPWGDLIERVYQPLTLWHGTEDNWASPGMSDRLATALPNVTAFHRLEGLSHYSTLKAALASIVPDREGVGALHA
jgi:pimeloyl-ACP methyl ester carboxylesterase